MSVLFNGVNSQISFPAGASAGAHATYTILGWFKHTADATQRWMHWEGAGGNGVGVRVNNGGVAGQFRGSHRDDAANIAFVDSIANVWGDGNWHRFHWHRHAAASFELFLDGVSQGTSVVNPGVTTINSVMMGTNNGVTRYNGQAERIATFSADLSAAEAEGILWGMHPSHDLQALYLLQYSINPQRDLSGNGFHSTAMVNMGTAGGAPIRPPFAGSVDYVPQRYISNYVLEMRRVPREQPDTPPVLWPPPDMPSFEYASLYGPWERKMELGVRGNWHSFLRK